MICFVLTATERSHMESPKRFDKLVGLTREKQKARIQIRACRITGDPFGHTLLFGIGGNGKTAFARCISEELNCYFVEREAAALRNRDQIVKLLVDSSAEAKKQRKPFILFIDEVHRLTLLLQEAFYYPMKEWRTTTNGGSISIGKFSLIAATTRIDMLDEASFIKRFQNRWELGRYHILHICEIVANVFRTQGLTYGPSEVRLVADRCLGIPRAACNLSMKVRDQVLAHGTRVVTSHDIMEVFRLEGIDVIGLTEVHIRYLNELERAQDCPRGLSALSGKLGQHVDVLTGHIEPALLALGFIDLHPRGRILTGDGRSHLLTAGHLRGT